MTLIKFSTAPTRNYRNPIEAFFKLRQQYGQWWKKSAPSESNARAWPSGLEPGKTPIFAHNETFIDKPPAEVFAALTNANEWASFYPNARDVKLPQGTSALEAGTKFSWSTFGTAQQSEVKEFEKDRALAWTAKRPGTLAYHRWILQPEGRGTRLITEETQKGPTASLDQLIMNPGLHAAHQLWLEQLKAKLEA